MNKEGSRSGFPSTLDSGNNPLREYDFRVQAKGSLRV